MTTKDASHPSSDPTVNPLLRSHMPELDSIRGIAAVAVLLYHLLYWARDFTPFTWWQARILSLASPGQFGVNLFFVLSGFLITGILLDSRSRPDYFLRFYYRRALRILPAYYLTLLLIFAFGLTSTGFLVMSLVYCANLSPLLGISLSYPVLWSLGVEEHFYLVWPTVVRFSSRAVVLGISIILFATSPFFRWLSYLHSLRSNSFGAGFAYYYTWNNLDGLALGAIIAVLLRREDWTRRKAAWLAALLFFASGALAAVGLPFGILTRKTALGTACQCVPWNLSFGGLLITFLLIGSSRWKRIVAPPFLTFFGQISYGLYLYHLMVIGAYGAVYKRIGWLAHSGLSEWSLVWLRMVVVSAVAVAVSYLSRRYFEDPFLKLKDLTPWTKRELLSLR